jgi:hypothetical protein
MRSALERGNLVPNLAEETIELEIEILHEHDN